MDISKASNFERFVFDLTGRVFFVTGGARHLGRDIEKDGHVETAPNCGTSEAPMRNQMKAWAEFMANA